MEDGFAVMPKELPSDHSQSAASVPFQEGELSERELDALAGGVAVNPAILNLPKKRVLDDGESVIRRPEGP